MFMFKVLARPVNKMILEYSLDKLVKKIRGDQLMNICTGEVLRERLAKRVRQTGCN